MKLFILAAGVGSRLFPLTKNTPKSLLNLGDGTTLLEHQIENAVLTPEITEIDIITGYKTEQVEAKIKNLKKNIKTIYNPFYDISNNLMSLWVANLLMDTDFLITNGDNLYKNHVFHSVIQVASQHKNTIQLTIDYKENYDDDDMKIIFDDSGSIARVHKDIPLNNVQAESVGLALVKGEGARKEFVKTLLELAKDKKYMNKFWLEIFNSLIAKQVRIDSAEIDKDDWREMDFHPDMEVIKSALQAKLFTEKR